MADLLHPTELARTTLPRHLHAACMAATDLHGTHAVFGSSTHRVLLAALKLGYLSPLGGPDLRCTPTQHLDHHTDIIYLHQGDARGALRVNHDAGAPDIATWWVWDETGQLVRAVMAFDVYSADALPYPSDPDATLAALQQANLDQFIISHAAVESEHMPGAAKPLLTTFRHLLLAASRWQSRTTPEQQRRVRTCLARNRPYNPALIDEVLAVPNRHSPLPH